VKSGWRGPTELDFREEEKVMNAQSPPSPQTAIPPASARPFSADEWQSLRREDKIAGGYVAGIMLAIFSLAVLAYALIGFVVASGN
jgi:hypothetical protein